MKNGNLMYVAFKWSDTFCHDFFISYWVATFKLRIKFWTVQTSGWVS